MRRFLPYKLPTELQLLLHNIPGSFIWRTTPPFQTRLSQQLAFTTNILGALTPYSEMISYTEVKNKASEKLY